MNDTQFPVRYTSHRSAAKALGVASITVTRWVNRGQLVWPDEGVTMDDLVMTRDTVAANRWAKHAAALKARRKYHTDEERAMAAYQAVKRYRHANAEEWNRQEAIRKALKRHPLYAELCAEMRIVYGPLCPACRKREINCVDHVVPLGQGGHNHPANLQPLCIPCNTAKRGKRTDYRPDQGYWLRIRWGGWTAAGDQPGQINGRIGRRWIRRTLEDGTSVIEKSGMGLGSVGARARHRQAVLDWRLARAHVGAMLDPAEYIIRKSSVDEAPTATLLP